MNRAKNSSSEISERDGETALPAVEYVASGTVSSNGVLLLPKSYRDAVGINGAACPILFYRLGDVLLILPDATRLEQIGVELAAKLEKQDTLRRAAK